MEWVIFADILKIMQPNRIWFECYKAMWQVEKTENVLKILFTFGGEPALQGTNWRISLKAIKTDFSCKKQLERWISTFSLLVSGEYLLSTYFKHKNKILLSDPGSRWLGCQGLERKKIWTLDLKCLQFIEGFCPHCPYTVI